MVFRWVRDEVDDEDREGIWAGKREADTVFAERKGDSAEQALLLHAMLGAVKVGSKLAWTSPRHHGRIQPKIPDPTQLDEVLGDEADLSPARPLAVTSNPYTLPPERRLTPLQLGFPALDRVETVVTWPAGWSVDVVPPDTATSNSSGRRPGWSRLTANSSRPCHAAAGGRRPRPASACTAQSGPSWCPFPSSRSASGWRSR